jgi:TolA-binding protein
MTVRTLLALAVLCSAIPARAAADASARDDLARDALADAKRDELIRDLDNLLPRMAASGRRADLEFQLAELWWEKARYASLRENRERDEAYGRWADAGRKGEEPRLEGRRSEECRKRALGLYRAILDQYPRYERRDEVLFVYGHNLYESGNPEQGVASYRALVDDYPQSRLVPDAYVQMGEHYFAGNDLPRARAAFEKAASFRLPKLYPFALYKLAWCDYNAGAYDAAVNRFQEVISYSEGEMRADRVQLKNEALRDIVLAYAHLDAVEGAIAYLSEKGGAQGTDSVERLAVTYFDAGKFEQAIRVYRILQERAPGHERAPAWQQRILLSYDKLNRRDQVASEMKRLVKGYGPDSGWAKANAEKKGAVAEASNLTESALRELVQDYHQEATKTKSAATYRLARDIYRQYLDNFPQSEAAVSMRFYSAEILYALEEWDAAAGEYAQVLEADPRGPFAQRAAYDAILALEKSVDVAKGRLKKRELADAAKIEERKDKGQVEQKRSLRLQTVTREVQEEAIPGNEEKLIAACDRYVQVAPGAKDEILIRYKAAFLLYERRHFLEAATRFGEIILKWPNDAWSQKAANLSLDILNTREEWSALNELGQRFLANASLCPPGSKFEAEVARIAEGAKFKSVLQIYEQKKDPALAAREFRAFVARYPKSEHAPKALYNALLIADHADELDVEIAAGEQLLRDYPDAAKEILERTVPALASACERAGRYTEAIRWYDLAQRRWPSNSKAADWLYDATLWRERLGDDAAAVQGWQRYVQLYRSRPDAARIAFDIGLIFERQKNPRRAAEHWSAFQREWSGTAAPARLLIARYRQGLALRATDAAQSKAILASIPGRFAGLPAAEKALPEAIDAAAHARFLAAEPGFDEFRAIRFHSARQGDLVAALKTKKARLATLIAAYAGVVEIGSPRWSEAAFARIGEAYRDFNKGLLDAPLPRGLDPEQEELYRNTLSAQALPLEDKAVEALGKAVEVSRRSGVYSEWVIRAQDLLRDYQPDAFGEVRRPAFADSERAAAVAPAFLAGRTR